MTVYGGGFLFSRERCVAIKLSSLHTLKAKQFIQNAQKGLAADISVICENISRIPATLHTETIDMLISHLAVPRDANELQPERLQLLDQSLRGISIVVDSDLRSSAPDIEDLCQSVLSDKWPKLLSFAEFIIDADFDPTPGAALGQGQFEKRLSSVFHTATKNETFVKRIRDRDRTASVVAQLLMRQDNRVGPPWSNEETIMALFEGRMNRDIIQEVLRAVGEDPGQIIDVLIERLKLCAKQKMDLKTVVHMDALLQLIDVLRTASERCCWALIAPPSLAVVGKAISRIAAAMTKGDMFAIRASCAVICGLRFYTTFDGYQSLSLAILMVNSGLFDVLIAVHPFMSSLGENGFGSLFSGIRPILDRVLPTYLLYGSFVQVTVTALRPLIKDNKLQVLSTGVFAKEWKRFEQLLLERYTQKMIREREIRNNRMEVYCDSVSTSLKPWPPFGD